MFVAVFLGILGLNGFVPSYADGAPSCLPPAFVEIKDQFQTEFARDVRTKSGLDFSIRFACDEPSPIPFNAELDTLSSSARLANTDEASLAEIVVRVSPVRSAGAVGPASELLSRYLGPDAFSVLLCHELGHIIGGEPRFPDSEGARVFFAVGKSFEGQADYFAANDCLRRFWQNSDNDQAVVRALASDLIETRATGSLIKRCETRFFTSPKEAIVCSRIALASLQLLLFLERETALELEPEHWRNSDSVIAVDSHDSSEVDESISYYPGFQCRFDTYLAGALAEPRPRCWFKAN